jgi:hypothetical protein
MSDPELGTETSTPSIEDSLAAAFEGATSTEDSGTTAPAAAPGSPASGEQNAALSPLDPPKHWSEVDRTLFGKAPREIQQRWIDREAETARGLDTKFQEIAGFRREREQYQQILQPYLRDLELAGQSPPQFIGALVGWHKYLQENPREGLLKLATTYGVDPKTLLAQEEATDPKFTQLNTKLTQVQSQVEGFMTQAQQHDHQQRLAHVQSFAEAKGEDGKPAHPYFEEVSQDIAHLMAAAKQSGNPITLEVAYNKALRMNDQVFEKVQSEKALAKSQAEDAKRKAEVDKAKRAAATNGAGSSHGSAKKLTLEQELEAKFDGWG